MRPEQIRQLSEYKKLIVQGNRKFQPRKDRNYIDDLSEIGLTIEEAWMQILSLNKNNYFFDPKPNYKSDKNTLIFKKIINRKMVYIKLKKEIDLSCEIVICLSFHIDKKEVGV